MSSGTIFPYSLEDRAALLGQFASVFKVVNEQLRPAANISRALQAAIGDDEIIVVPKVTMTSTGKVFHVTGNFGSAAEALDAGNYDLRWGLAEKPTDIPLIVQPVDAKVRAVPLGEVVQTRQLFELYPRIVDPMTALTFGVKFSEEQREVTHFTVWKDAIGGFWDVVLNASDRGRGVRVSQGHPGGRWSAYCRVLVREFRQPQADG